MPETKRIVVLANSRKPPGRCVAGIELVDGDAADWVRPVGDRAGAGLTRPERLLADRSEPLPLDVVDFVVGRPVPVDCHRENWLLRSGSPRGRVGTFDFDDLDALASNPKALWSNDAESQLGVNDWIAESELEEYTHSILLLGRRDVVLQARRNPWSREQELRAEFNHRGVMYLLKVTDPVYEERYLTGVDGDVQILDAFLTISLGVPWSKSDAPRYSSKLVAALIERPGD
ncbi:dual OB domain-containing protein [Microbacterium paulum]